MARGRMIDRRVGMSKKLGKISDKSKVLWFMLLPHLDREGRISFDDLEDLKDEIIPKFKDWRFKKIADCLNELSAIKLIKLYSNGDNIAISYVKFDDFQTGMRKEREAESKISTPPRGDSGVLQSYPEGSPFKLSKGSKAKEGRKELIENNMSEKKPDDVENSFNILWKDWPAGSRFKKKYCLMKFKALCKQGKKERFRKTTIGYHEFLKHKKLNEDFDQKPMHLSTWMNNWEGEQDTYMGFEYKPKL